ncbi:MAG TPA: phage holin family protein [Gemmatimonadaceae bacterium]|nr:phage holin family protein [Gemmatimonadaceae bacterium]
MSISHRVQTDPDAGIPDLIRNLADDSKRLVSDEMRLAKLEMSDNVKRAGKGGMWLGLAFGVGFVAMVAFTILLSALIGRLANGNYWLGALVTGILELVVAVVLFKKGMGQVTEPSYTLEETRREAGKTVRWAKTEIRS